MSNDPKSAVSEALSAPIYAVPQHVEERSNLRAKLEERSAAALTTTELVALILGSSTGKAAKRIVQGRGLQGIEGLDLAALQRLNTGRAGAARLAACLELHRRLSREKTQESPKLSRPSDVYREVREIRKLKKEHLIGLYLDAQNNLLHRETISIGSLNTTRTHPREILFPAIQQVALGFILAHNHPSGCLEPSTEDVEFTRSVQRAGELMGIELYDHVIVAGSGFTSMRERGLL